MTFFYGVGNGGLITVKRRALYNGTIFVAIPALHISIG